MEDAYANIYSVKVNILNKNGNIFIIIVDYFAGGDEHS